MAVYTGGIAFGLVEDVDLVVIGDEHLLWERSEGGRGEGNVAVGIRTIMADTKVSPTSTIEPGVCATAAVASPRASKGILECIAWYSGAMN